MAKRRCEDCRKPTDAGPCPHRDCGKVVCPRCAEREGAFCCSAEDGCADCKMRTPTLAEESFPTAGPIFVPPIPPPTGWLCPACGGGLSPFVDRCPCVPMENAYRVTTGTSSGAPAPREDGDA